MKTIIIKCSATIVLLFLSVAGFAQVKNGCVISIEDGDIYIDLKYPYVHAGDTLSVFTSGGYMNHPVTGKKIKRQDRVITPIIIKEVFAEYATAKPLKDNILNKIKAGMKVRMVARLRDDIREKEDIPAMKVPTKTNIPANIFNNPSSGAVNIPAHEISNRSTVVVAP